MDKQPIRPTRAEINLDHLRFNLKHIKERVGEKSRIIAIVKADAYGHGPKIANTLEEEGVDFFGVAFLDEAISLRKQGIKAEILILGYTDPSAIPQLIEWKITPCVYNYDFAEQLSKSAKAHHIVHPIHVKIDTGMGRIGFAYGEAAEIIKKIATLKGIMIQGLFTHFATADAQDKSFTNLQLLRFKQVVNTLNDHGINIPVIHVENSGAIVDFPSSVFNAVRPGIILYGHYPSEEVRKENLCLKPVMTLKTKVVHIKKIHPGDSVSYGRHYIAEEPRIIATLPIGYADGFTRMLSSKGTHVWIRGKRAPVLGNICMDQCMVDITDIKGVKLGDDVEIFGKNLCIEEHCERLGTINYELLCMVTKRVPRIYLDGQVISP